MCVIMNEHMFKVKTFTYYPVKVLLIQIDFTPHLKFKKIIWLKITLHFVRNIKYIYC